MIKKSVIIDIQTGDAQKDIDKLKDSIVDLGSEGSKAMNKTAESVNKVGKAGGNAKKGLNSVSTGFKAIGTAMKAAGIGLVITLFVTLKEILGQNQKVMDFLSSTMTTLVLAFNSIGSAISDAYAKASELTGGFDALKKVGSGLITLVLTPLKLAFYEIKFAIVGLQLVWEKSFLGKGRPEKIDELQTSLTEVKLELLEIGKAAIKAGKDVVNNIAEAGGEIVSLTKSSVEEIGKISIEALRAQADAITKIKNQAKIARAINAGLIEDYDRQAEQQRQIRDDVNKSITERQEANNKLNAILDEQEKAMIRNANLSIQAARDQLSVNNNIETQVALQETLNEKKAILAQIEGKRSEQLVNETALINELSALEQTAAEGEITRAIAKRNASAELIRNEDARRAQQLVNLEIDKKVELDRLQNVIDSTKAGTQMRVDAEQARLNSIQEFAIKEDELNEEIRIARAESAMERAILDSENEYLSFESRRLALDTQRQLILDDESLSEANRNQMLQDNSTARMQIDTLEAEHKLKMADLIGSGLAALSDIVGKQTAAGKAFAIASTLISTYLSAQGAYASQFLPIPDISSPLRGALAAGIAVASGLANVKNILKVKTPGGGGASGGQPVGKNEFKAPPIAPNFNVVGTSGENQIAQTIAGQRNQPIKAYVVSTDISTQQQLDRSIESDASFG